MPNVTIEFLGPINLYLGLGVEILTAIILGGLIGLDRERKMKSAGIKTNILICLGSTLYTATSIIHYVNNGHSGIDPNRVSAQIVSGIGFLGAGAILQGRGEIIGLTTAATIWVVAAVGVVIGNGYPVIAVIFVFTILCVLRLLDPLYRYLSSSKGYSLEILSTGSVVTKLKQFRLLEKTSLLYEEEIVVDRDKDQRILYLELFVDPKRIKLLAAEIEDLIQVERVKYHLIHLRKSEMSGSEDGEG